MIDDGWAVIGEDEEAAQAVVDATGKGTLADDPEFQELTAAAGSAGIVTLYAAPEAGQYFADSMGGMTGLGRGPRAGSDRHRRARGRSVTRVRVSPSLAARTRWPMR